MVTLSESISGLGPRRTSRGHRVTATYPQGGTGIPAGTTNYIYYDSQWQAIETRSGGTANSNVTSQTVWSAAYPGAAAHMRPAAATGFRGIESDGVLGSDPHPLNINAPVLQDTYSAGVIQPNSRLYFVQDANWNTTAVIGYDSTTQTWNVVQRYVYSPYGNLIVLSPDFTTAPSGTVPMVNKLYQGMALDPVTGLYYERARWYSASLGTWISQDPAGYINGADTYQFVGSDPVRSVDPWGRQLEPDFYNFYGTPEPEYVRDKVQQAEHEVEQQVLHKLCRCATDAAELAGTLASLGVDIDEGVDTFGTSVVVTAPLIAMEVLEANTELGRLARDGCVPSYRQLVSAAHSLIFLAGTLVGPPSAANAHPSAPSNP